MDAKLRQMRGERRAVEGARPLLGDDDIARLRREFGTDVIAFGVPVAAPLRRGNEAGVVGPGVAG